VPRLVSWHVVAPFSAGQHRSVRAAHQAFMQPACQDRWSATVGRLSRSDPLNSSRSPSPDYSPAG
jgi:hypothetical protein